MTTIKTFTFGNSSIRATAVEGHTIVFSVEDVAKALNYRKTYDLSRLIDSRELFSISGSRMVTEYGLVWALHKSIKPESKAFIKWVQAVVWPNSVGRAVTDSEALKNALLKVNELEKLLKKKQSRRQRREAKEVQEMISIIMEELAIIGYEEAVVERQFIVQNFDEYTYSKGKIMTSRRYLDHLEELAQHAEIDPVKVYQDAGYLINCLWWDDYADVA